MSKLYDMTIDFPVDGTLDLFRNRVIEFFKARGLDNDENIQKTIGDLPHESLSSFDIRLALDLFNQANVIKEIMLARLQLTSESEINAFNRLFLDTFTAISDLYLNSQVTINRRAQYRIEQERRNALMGK